MLPKQIDPGNHLLRERDYISEANNFLEVFEKNIFDNILYFLFFLILFYSFILAIWTNYFHIG